MIPKPITPCSPHCPTVTGKPHGAVAYCPKAEPERHKRFMAEHPGYGVYSRIKPATALLNKASREPRTLTSDEIELLRQSKTELMQHPDATHTTIDWRTGERVGVRATEDGWDPEIPPHPDETNCCIDFGCCPDAFKGVLGGVFAAMVKQREAGEPIVHVKPQNTRGDT